MPTVESVPRDGPLAFIGRQVELAQLDAAWDRVVGGDPHLLLVGGDAGIGKTRLVQEWVGLPGGDRVVVRGGCVPVAGGSLPYTPFVEILRTLVSSDEAEDGPAAALASLTAASLAELGRLVPAVRLPTSTSSPIRAEADSPLVRARLFEAVLTYVVGVAAQAPLLLVIEDLHWADGSSRDLLSYLTRNLRTERILVLATYRTDELHRRHPLRSWLAEMNRLDASERLELHPLADDDLRADVADQLGPGADPGVVDRIVQRAEGNPLFASELVASSRHATDPRLLPETLRDGLLGRVAGLGPDALLIARHAAVFGRPVSEQQLEDSTGLAADRLAAGVHQALDDQVVITVHRETGDRFELRHALLGEAIVDDLLPGEQTALHRRIADLLDTGVDEDDDPARIAGEIAHHRWAAHDIEAAIGASVRAATAAVDARAYAEADAHWTRALEAWPAEGEVEGFDHPAALLKAAMAADGLWHPRRAADLATRAIELIDARSDPLRAALAHRQLGYHLSTIDRRAFAAHVGRAARLIQSVNAPAEAARILAARAVVLGDRLQFERAEPIARRALELNDPRKFPQVEPDALGVLGWSLLARSEHGAAIELLERVFELATRLDEPSYALIQVGFGLCRGLNGVGRWGSMLELHDRYVERVQELGLSRLWSRWMHDCRVAALLGLGRWREAESVTDTVLAEHDIAENPWIGGVAAVVWVRRGRVAEAARLAALAVADPRSAPVEWLAPVSCLSALAEVALAQGRWSALRETVAWGFSHVPVGVRDTYPDLRPFVLYGLQAEAEIAFESRIRRDAEAEAEALGIARELAGWMRNLARRLTEAGEPLAQATLADAAFAEALLTRVEHHADPDAWRLALERCEVVGNPYDIARARHWLAEAILERGGSRSEATAALTLALVTAEELGAVGLERAILDLARRARLELGGADDGTAAETGGSMAEEHGLGSTPTETAVERPPELIEPLTPREREVLGYLALGWTNRRIGEALFISDKTVSVHVSNLLGKLGAANRAEAALIGDRLGLVASRSNHE